MSEVINHLQSQIEECKRMDQMADAVLRLNQNPDFKLVVEQGYFLHEAARHAKSASNPALSQIQRDDILSMAMAAGHFERFLSVIVQKGNWGKGQIERLDQEIENERYREVHGDPEEEVEDDDGGEE